MIKSKSKLLFPLLVLLVLMQLPVRASTGLKLDLATQIDQADLIFAGTVQSMESVPTGDGKFAFTYVTFSVEQTFKGAAPGPVITLRFAGGEAPPNIFEVTGAPAFAVGGKHLLFVEGNGRMLVPLTGWEWGKIDIVDDPVTRQQILVDHAKRAIDGIEGADWKRGRLALNADGLFRTAPAAAVVSEQGVKIVLDEATAHPVRQRAANVLGQLDALVASRRATSKTFRQAPMVVSASKADVPATFVFHAAPARAK